MPPDLSDTRLPFWAEVRGQSGDWGAQPGCPPAHVPELIKGGTAGTTPGPGGPQSRGAALLGATLEPEGVQGVGGPAEARPTGEGQPLAPHHPPRFWAEGATGRCLHGAWWPVSEEEPSAGVAGGAP